MAIFSPAMVLPFWYQALREEIGIAIPTSDKKHLVAQLYKARQESGDPRLNELMVFNPNGGEVFIVKKSTEMEE